MGLIGWRRYLVNIFFILAFIMLIGPGTLFGNRIYPLVFGAPFFYFWTGLWLITIIIGIIWLAARVWRA